MELYTLDSLRRRQYVFDQYISLVWAERYSKFGDFELHIASTYRSRSLLTPDTYVAMSKSDYVARIEIVEDDVTAEGNRILIIKGRTMEAVLLDRVTMQSFVSTDRPWIFTGEAVGFGETLFFLTCIDGTLSPKDILPGVSIDWYGPPSTIPIPEESVSIALDPMTVYDALVTKMCDPWDLGFRLLREDSTGTMYFNVYTGSDRTSGQTVLPAVVFSPELDNLQNTKEMTKIDAAKNVAIVFNADTAFEVYPIDIDPTTSGFDRRLLVVDATDITVANAIPNVTAAMTQRANEGLAAARVYQGFDGEISQNSQYKYGRDYNLGDLVEVRNVDGVANIARVTEQIFTNDSEGFRSYPTLTFKYFINSGSWLAEPSGRHWLDLDLESTTWSELP